MMAGRQQTGDRGVGAVAFGPVVRQQLGARLDARGELRRQRLADVAVQLAPPAAHQRRVGRVLDQRVLEHERLLRLAVDGVQDVELAQATELATQPDLFDPRRRLDELEVERPPDHRAQLGQILRRSQAIQARDQRLLQRRRHAEIRERAPRRWRCAPLPCRCVPAPFASPASSTSRVTSSTYSGTPSDFSTRSRTSSGGSGVEREILDHQLGLRRAQPNQVDARDPIVLPPGRRASGRIDSTISTAAP